MIEYLSFKFITVAQNTIVPRKSRSCVIASSVSMAPHTPADFAAVTKKVPAPPTTST
jgi:hypothetical protein